MRLLERRLTFKRPDTGGRRLNSQIKGLHPTDDTPRSLEETIEKTETKSRTYVRDFRKLKSSVNVSVSSLAAICIRMLLISSFAVLLLSQFAHAGFFTFYFPNIFKPKGFSELSDMINSLEGQINASKDNFQDIQYFWGQLEQLDKGEIENDYPEESACSEVFPLFREQAINYVHLDYKFYLTPMELYLAHVKEFRDKWYPAGLESKAALPREWEQKLMEKELELKIESLSKLTLEDTYREKRARLIEIWKSVRRSLDTSVPCLYLRYAYRQIAEDINQVALEANLEGMQEAMKMLVRAYKRIEKFKDSDAKIKQDIEEELIKFERFTIKT